MPATRSGEGARTRSSSSESSSAPATAKKAALRVVATSPNGYELPVIHLHLSERTVNMGFWGALVGSAAFGAIDPPLAILIGLGVLVARHRQKS